MRKRTLIDTEITEHLLPFFENNLKRSKQLQIRRNEPDKELINRACRLHLVVATKRKGTKSVQGYRFTPLGRSFLVMVIKEREMKKHLAKLETEIRRLSTESHKPAKTIVREKITGQRVISVLSDLSRTQWTSLLGNTNDTELNKKLRTLLIELMRHRKKQDVEEIQVSS
jgi:hypothetical protein